MQHAFRSIALSTDKPQSINYVLVQKAWELFLAVKISILGYFMAGSHCNSIAKHAR